MALDTLAEKWNDLPEFFRRIDRSRVEWWVPLEGFADYTISTHANIRRHPPHTRVLRIGTTLDASNTPYVNLREYRFSDPKPQRLQDLYIKTFGDPR